MHTTWISPYPHKCINQVVLAKNLFLWPYLPIYGHVWRHLLICFCICPYFTTPYISHDWHMSRLLTVCNTIMKHWDPGDKTGHSPLHAYQAKNLYTESDGNNIILLCIGLSTIDSRHLPIPMHYRSKCYRVQRPICAWAHVSSSTWAQGSIYVWAHRSSSPWLKGQPAAEIQVRSAPGIISHFWHYI